MIRITKHGKDLPQIEQVGSCRRCGCEVECLSTDGVPRDMSMGGEGFVIDCPHCHALIGLESKADAEAAFQRRLRRGERAV